MLFQLRNGSIEIAELEIDDTGQLRAGEDLVKTKELDWSLKGLPQCRKHLVVLPAACGNDQHLSSNGLAVQPVGEQEGTVLDLTQKCCSGHRQVELARGVEATLTL